LFQLILTFRPENTQSEIKLSKEDLDQVKGQLRDDIGVITDLLERMPRDFLLVLKTQSLIRSINLEIGANLNRFETMAIYGIRGLHRNAYHSASLLARMLLWKETFLFHIQLKIFNLLLWFASFWRNLIV